MNTTGKIASWNDEKGYGFISPLAGGDRTFVHIKAFGNHSRRPVVGDVITYSVSTDTRGRPCAKEATIAGAAKTRKRKNSSVFLPHVLAFGFLLIVAGTVLVSSIPAPVLFVYLIVSSATFSAYVLDKMAAEKGGWPGALIAQSHLRHKTRKQPFRTIFWGTVVLNCAILAWLFTPAGVHVLRSTMAAVA